MGWPDDIDTMPFLYSFIKHPIYFPENSLDKQFYFYDFGDQFSIFSLDLFSIIKDFPVAAVYSFFGINVTSISTLLNSE